MLCVWLIQNSRQFQYKLLDAPRLLHFSQHFPAPIRRNHGSQLIHIAIICCIHDYKWNNEFINAHTICYIMTMHIKRTFIVLGFKCAHLAANTHIYDIYLSYRQAAICYFITDSIHVHIFFHILIITWLLLISINLRVHGK